MLQPLNECYLYRRILFLVRFMNTCTTLKEFVWPSISSYYLVSIGNNHQARETRNHHLDNRVYSLLLSVVSRTNTICPRWKSERKSMCSLPAKLTNTTANFYNIGKKQSARRQIKDAFRGEIVRAGSGFTSAIIAHCYRPLLSSAPLAEAHRVCLFQIVIV